MERWSGDTMTLLLSTYCEQIINHMSQNLYNYGKIHSTKVKKQETSSLFPVLTPPTGQNFFFFFLNDFHGGNL